MRLRGTEGQSCEHNQSRVKQEKGKRNPRIHQTATPPAKATQTFNTIRHRGSLGKKGDVSGDAEIDAPAPMPPIKETAPPLENPLGLTMREWRG